MIGLGKWACNVKTMFFTGEAKISVFDNNGEYGFKLEVPGVTVPKVTIKELKEEGDTINAVVQTDLLPDKDIDLSITFDGDEFDGFIKVPYIGKIKFRDGHRIEE